MTEQNLEEQPQEEVQEEPQEEAQEEQASQEAPAEAAEPEEITVMIGDDPVEEETQAAPDWVRELRKKNREDQKRIRELEAKLAQTQAPAQTLGKKPELEEYDYDTARYETALADWFEKKRQYDEQLQAQRRAEEEQNQTWQQKLEGYAQARTSLKVKDFEDAESTVAEQFNVTQQGVVIQGAENPALVIYALGKNPKKAKELAAISDPVKFAFAIAKLETQLKVAKKTPPPPEKVVGGTAPIRGAIDSNLERLRADAERTGDYSKVFAYKRQKRA